MEPLQKMNIAELGERVIKLSIPNTYVWLLVFYLYFHLWLNLLAELTLFGDRAFYKDWWNARTIENYWRNWNLPVHHWCLRHLCESPPLHLLLLFHQLSRCFSPLRPALSPCLALSFFFRLPHASRRRP
jgi:hypothetical protein